MALRRTVLRALSERKLGDVYYQEAFEALTRFQNARTYPGPVRAAVPGDTACYMGSTPTLLPAGERHYWRPVTDDPVAPALLPLRVRFKGQVWVSSGWQTRMHVVQVMVAPETTIRQLIEQVHLENQSPYLCNGDIALAVHGRELDLDKTVEECGIHEHSPIDAVDVDTDHVGHLPQHRLKDWTTDELKPEDAARSPYKEMGYQMPAHLAPRMQQVPANAPGKLRNRSL